METAKQIMVHRQHIQVVVNDNEKQLKNLEEQLADKESDIGKRIKEKILVHPGIAKDVQVIAYLININDAIVNITNYNFKTQYRDGDMIIENRNEKLFKVQLSLLNCILGDIEEVLKEEGLL